MSRKRALEAFQREHLRRGLSPATLRGRLYTAKRFLRFTEQPIKSVTVKIVRDYLAFRAAAGVTRSLKSELIAGRAPS